MILVASDIHVGLESSRHDAFASLFADTINSYDAVILLGDIIQGNYPGIAEDGKEFFAVLAKAKRIIYVLGNHDDDGQKELPFDEWVSYAKTIFPIQTEYVRDCAITVGGKGFRFVHGHQYCAKDTAFTVGVSRMFKSVQSLLGRRCAPIFETVDKLERSLSGAVEKVRAGAASEHFPGTVICGHTHKAESSSGYVNVGQWIYDTVTWVEIDDNGNVHSHSWSIA